MSWPIGIVIFLSGILISPENQYHLHFTLLFPGAHGHDVAAFEPNPIMFLRVCESLEYNNWKDDKGFSLWNYGLGTKTGVFDLKESWGVFIP